MLDRRLVATLLAVDLALLGLRLFAVVDATRGPRTAAARAILVLLVLVTALPHAAAGYVTVRSYDVLETVFAKEEPRDVLPSRGLFLGALITPPPRYPGIAAPPSAPRPRRGRRASLRPAARRLEPGAGPGATAPGEAVDDDPARSAPTRARATRAREPTR